MLKNINRDEVERGVKFKLNGSDHIFILAGLELSLPRYIWGEDVIVDITAGYVYEIADVANQLDGFGFFEKEDDDDFLGVEVIK